VTEISTSAGVVDVQDTGSGEPIVFLHPFATNSKHWRHVVAKLDGEFRCIAPTMPIGSHVKPMNPDADLTPPGLARIVIDILDALGIDKATVVGNDSGGAITQIAATTYPDRVSRMALVSCDAYDVFPPKLFGYLKVVAAIPGATLLLAKSMKIPGVTQLPIAFGWITTQPIPKDVMSTYIGPLNSSAGVRRDTVKVVKGLNKKYTLAAAEHFPTLETPTLVAWGSKDRFFPRRLADRLVRELPNARLEIIEGSRTLVPEDAPDALADALRNFVNST
jgi:pimeloyl-ACP methyl ester carboxylesterase